MVKPDFDELVERHSTEIFAYAWRMLRETSDAEDCLQETFLRAFRSYGRVRAGTNYRAWLYKIATNTARSQWKRRKCTEIYTIDLDLDFPAGGMPVAERVEQKTLLAAVTQAVEALPDQQRAALIMALYRKDIQRGFDAVGPALKKCAETSSSPNPSH
jgi:RNA polymerase sigma-70 factor (ECF subfamily)